MRLSAGGTEMIQLTEGTDDAVVFNEAGGDVDFRVESDNNTHALFVEGSTDRVGIGTDDPAKTLHVTGEGRFDDMISIQRTAGEMLELKTTNSGSNFIGFDQGGSLCTIVGYAGGGDSRFMVKNQQTAGFLTLEASAITFQTSAAERMRINSDGEVGIGLNVPNATLTVKGTGADANSHSFTVQNSSNQKSFSVRNDGKVGIGTTVPDNDLHIYGDGAPAKLRLESSSTHDTQLIFENSNRRWLTYQDSAGKYIIADNTAGKNRIQIPTDGSMSFSTNSVDAINISTAGNVGIGTASPQEKLNVSGNIRIDDGKILMLRSSGNTYGGEIYKDGYNGTIDIGNQTNIFTDVLVTKTDEGSVQIGESSLYSHGRNAIWPLQAAKFAVYAGVQDDGGTGGAGFGFFNQGSAGKFLAMVPNVTDANNGGFKLQTMSSSSVVEAMFFKSDGSIGVGTDNPAQTFHIKGIGMIEDTSSTAYGTLQFGTNTSRYIRGNSAELQVGSTIQQLHFQNTSAVGQIASSAGNGTDAIQILARTVHTSANILEVVNGNGADPIFIVDYTGNVGIGVTPVYDLTIGGNAVGSTGGLRINDPSNAAFGAHFSFADTPNEVQFGGITADVYNDAIGINREATRTITIDASEQVGVGTSSPSDKFHVEQDGGTVTIGSPTTSYGGIGFEDTALTAANSALYGVASQTVIGVKAGGAIEMKIANNSSLGLLKMEQDKLYYTDGNVGIGTDAPAGKLQVYTSANRHTTILGSTADLEVVSDNNTNPVALIKGVGTADLLNVFDNTTEVFTILDGGNVGIGTASPAQKLHLTDGSMRFDAEIMLRDNRDNTILKQSSSSTASNRTLQIGGTNDVTTYNRILFGQAQGGDLRVGIGTTAPSHALTVSGDVFLDGDAKHIFFGGTNTFVGESSNSQKLQLRGGGSTSAHTISIDSQGRMGFGNTATERITITDGNIELVNSNTGVDLGTLNNADGKQSVALGYDNDALGLQSVAVGSFNNSTGAQAITFGNGNNARRWNSNWNRLQCHEH